MKKTTKRIITGLVLLSIFLTFPAQSFCQLIEEYGLKAVFLERFTRFVDWPPDSLPADSDQSFVIGVIGENPFGGILHQYFLNRTIKDRPVLIKEIHTFSEIDSCQVLFIPSAMKTELKDIVLYLKNKPVLAVGDTNGYAEQGVQINFFMQDEKLRFQINQKAAEEAGLKMSYHLLKLAQKVSEY